MDNLTSPLLTEVQAILEGSSGVARLGEVLETTRADLAALRADFQAAVDRETEATRGLVIREIRTVEQAFDDYEAVLDSAAGYLQGFDKAYLESVARNLPLAIARLDLDFLAYREAAMAERGPTTHAGINYLAALVALSLAGEDHREAFEAQVGFEVARAEMGLQEPAEDPLAQRRRQFHQRYLEHLEACPGPAERSWLDGLMALGSEYASLDLATLERRFGWAPSPLPAINLVVNGLWLHSQGKVARELADYLVQQAHLFVAENLESHAQMRTLLEPNDPAQGPAERAHEALERLLDGLEGCLGWLEGPGQDLDPLARPLLEAAADLATARDELQGASSPGAACNICGLSNPAGAARCSQCGSKLGAAAFEVKEEAGPTAPGGSPRLQKLLEVAGHVLKGWTEPAALQGLLEEMQQSLVVARRKARPPEELTESDRQGPLGAAATSYVEALDEMEEGLELLAEFAQDPAHEVLEKAQALVSGAGEKLQELQQTLASLTN